MVDRKEFEQLVPSLRKQAMNTALFILRDRDEAEDTAQETLLKLWIARGKIDKADKKLTALAITIARNTAISKLRQAHETVNLDEMQDTSRIAEMTTKSTPQTKMEESEDRQWMTAATSKLPPAYRAILHMSQVENMSNSEIADITGSTEASIRAMLSKARNIMLQQLKARYRHA